MEYCPDHAKLSDNVVQIKVDVAETKTTLKALDYRINGSIADIEKHIEHGQAWRVAIVCSSIGWVIAIAVQIAGFCYMWGRLTAIVDKNSDKINVLEELHPREK